MASLGCDPAPVVDFVGCSFVFMLDRELPISILQEFNLRVISKYFPESEEEIGKILESFLVLSMVVNFYYTAI